MKKFLVLVLCLVFVLAVMPVGAVEVQNFDVRVELLSYSASFDESSGYTSILDNDVIIARLNNNTGDHQVEAGTGFSISIDEIAEGYFVEYRVFDTGDSPSDDFTPLDVNGVISIDPVTIGKQIDIRIYRNYTVSVNVGDNGAIRVHDDNYRASDSAHEFIVKGGDDFYIVVTPDVGYTANEYTKDSMGELLDENDGIKSISLSNVNADTAISIPFMPQVPSVQTSFYFESQTGMQILSGPGDGDSGEFIIMNGDIPVGSLPEGLNNEPNAENTSVLRISFEQGYTANYYVSDTVVHEVSSIAEVDWTPVIGNIEIPNVTTDKYLYIVFIESQTPVLDDPINININLEGSGSLQVIEPQGSTYTNGSVTIERNSSLELRLLPDAGFNVVAASANGQDILVRVSGDNTLRIDNIPGDMSMTIRFGPGGGGGDPGPGDGPPPMAPFDLTINKPANGKVYYYADPDSESLTELTASSAFFEQLESPMIVYLKPNAGYKAAAVQHLTAGMTAREDCSYLLSYDPNIMFDSQQGLIAVSLEFWDDTEVFFEFSPFTAADMTGIQVSILNSENGDDDAAKNAIRRELGYYGFDVPVSSISVGSTTNRNSDNGVPYNTRSFTAMGYTSTVYVVEHVSNGIFISNGTYSDGTTGRKVYIYVADDLSTALWGNQSFSVQPIVEGTLDLFGPYKLGYIGTFSPDTADALSLAGNYNYRMDINRYFGRVALHIGNSADESILNDRGLSLNWYMMTLIQEDALAIRIMTGAEIGGFQGAHGLDLDNVADLSSGDAEINMFFGNDYVYIEKPANDAGDIQTMTTPEIDHPGYTIRMVNGAIEVFFKSNFYDRLTIPITITREDGTTVVRNLTVIRTGIEFEHFIRSDGNPDADTVNVGHGTQRGSEINIRGENSYFVVASYLIQDFGDTLPYGLLVTRTYDDGTIETDIVSNPIDSPPDFFNAFDYRNGIYYYNTGVPADDNGPAEYNANVADYMVFAGNENGRVPAKINVLVLKADPANIANGSFGGFYFGSGSGVEWNRPN
ncbi:MAG: hypothetical protein GX639_16400 [Fibrobacter sp.]|nr:hypothetical protein [Fibrobacter sp.]